MSRNALEVLRARARALARPPQVDAHVDSTVALDVMRVHIGALVIALTTDLVISVVRAPRITPLPRAQRPVLGLGAWRGRPLTMLTLDARPDAAPGRLMVVMGRGNRAIAALLVDDVEDVATIDRSAISDVPSGPLSRYALGVAPDTTLVIDTALLLDTLRNASPSQSSPS